MVHTLTKSEIIRASSCFPIFGSESLKSTRVTQHITEEISTYRSKDGYIWTYDDVFDALRSICKAGHAEEQLAHFLHLRDPIQVKSKHALLKFLLQKLDLSGAEVLDISGPRRQVTEHIDFVPPYDLIYRIQRTIHFVFVIPNANVALKKVQSDLLIPCLSQPILGVSETQILHLFDFPATANGRDGTELTREFQSDGINPQLQHFARFHLEDLSYRRPDAVDLFGGR